MALKNPRKKKKRPFYLVIQVVTFLGWLNDPFKGLSDIQLGDEKVTLNHLVYTSSNHLNLVDGFSPTHPKKYAQVKLDHFPRDENRDENKIDIYLEQPPSHPFF